MTEKTERHCEISPEYHYHSEPALTGWRDVSDILVLRRHPRPHGTSEKL
jgi:hypothetical protein